MVLGIGYGIPFSYFGIAIGFLAFGVILTIVVSVELILERQDVIW